MLDDELKWINRNVWFPPFPPGGTGSRKTLELTIEFTLKGGLAN